MERDGKKLVPTPLGITINDILEDKFSDIVNVKFSAEMENDLDKIEAGQRDWLRVLHQFYNTFRADLKKAEEETEGQKIKVPEEFTGENCPDCG